MNSNEKKMQVYSGFVFNPLTMQSSDINIEDIAHALALTNRYGGHSNFPYSVAQHSVLVAQVLPFKLQRWGLMHDAAEAYLGDIIHPIKIQLPNFKHMELMVMRTLADHFNLDWPEPPEVKEADLMVGVAECFKFSIKVHDTREVKLTQHVPIEQLHWSKAKQMFLDKYWELFNR